MAILTDETVSKYWNWTCKLKMDVMPPKGECLIDNSDPSLVYLMDPADVSSSTMGELKLDCTQFKITSKQQILVPLWIAWCDGNEVGSKHAHYAKKRYNLGHIQSGVNLDGASYAKLDVTVSNVDDNISETYETAQRVTTHTSEDRPDLAYITIPPESIKLKCPGAKGFSVKEGTISAGFSGWWTLVKLDKLESGIHEISYQTTVGTDNLPSDSETSPGTPFTSAKITYKLKIV
ncbi:MAG: hypothetical protein WBF33_29610 [Candidatus Nitrosopolaris sp.]|jgi:hypothetical protein